jgi:hypothetical protein
MSGAEFFAGIGIAASIIQIVDTCSKVIDRIQDFRRDTAFRDISSQLSLLMKDIEAINSPEYKNLLDSETEEALVRVLEGCRRQLVKLDQLIQGMTPARSSRFGRAWKGIQSLGKDNKVQEISGILSGYKSTITLHLASRRVQDLHVNNASPTTTKSFFEVPGLKVSNFVGRTELLEQIELTLVCGKANPAVVVLTGVGGQGKVQSDFLDRCICTDLCDAEF